jgi:hypothetical protein
LHRNHDLSARFHHATQLPRRFVLVAPELNRVAGEGLVERAVVERQDRHRTQAHIHAAGHDRFTIPPSCLPDHQESAEAMNGRPIDPVFGHEHRRA